MKIKHFALSALIFFAAHCAFSLTLEELAGAESAGTLRAGASLAETQTRNPSLRLLPNHAGVQKLVLDSMAALNPSVTVETLYLYKKPSSEGIWSEAQRTALFNGMLALSTLAGIEYYSASRGTMRTFYEASHVIDGENTRNPLPDPVFPAPPEMLSLFARQKDLTFGDNIYRYDFKAMPDAFVLAQENMTALTAGIIPAVGRNRLKSVFSVIDCGDSLLIYAVSMARTASVPGMADRIGSSFGNRAEAVYKWFISRAEGIF